MADDERPRAENPGGDRPRQVTMGAWVAGGCSAAMLLAVFTVMSKLRTVDFRESVTEFLRQQSAAGVSVTLDEAMTIIRIGLMVTGAVSAAMLVFAFFAARRDKSARIAMSVLAVPMLVCGIFVDPFLSGFVVAATVLLWTGPAADWYAGRAPRPAVAGPPQPTPPPPAYRSVDLDTLPPPSAPGTSAPASAPLAFGAVYGETAASVPAPPTPGPRRPARLVAGCVVAAVPSLLVAGLMTMTAIVVQTAAGRTELRRVLEDNPSANPQNLSVDALATACTVVAAVLAVWGIAAFVLAGVALTGRAWARWALVGSAGAAALGGLAGTLAFPGFLVITGAGVLCVVQLLHPDVTAWYAARRPTPTPPPGVPPREGPW